ncbi:ABC transporter permease [Segeticoccus rhizosphaerae]|jgi:peptide/nickel transport system permease protein|uniref:ABC transporter permease n=1 Tax=Segeticoccus rhizosphaerae TaxID=1104777 RepID=UPI0010C13CE9|nr:ABC transporter permease [Ornithinicoccus soli]
MTQSPLPALPTTQTQQPRRRTALPVSIVVSVLVLALVAACVVGSQWIVPGATTQDILLGRTPAGTPHHLLGTDDLGRDILALTIAGTRSAIVGPIVIAAGSMAFGILLGTIAGYHGGLIDALLARYADLILALPAVLLAIVVAGIVGGGYWVTVALLIVLFSPSDIRLIRGSVMEQRAMPYIEACSVLGMRRRRIMFGQIVPNVVPIIITNFMLNIVFALVAMSSLSYLGLGVGPGAPDWGRQLADGRNILGSVPTAVLAPGIAIILTATAVNIVGDWLFERLQARVAAR